MKRLIEWLVLASTLMLPGLDAAPQEATAHAKDSLVDYDIRAKKLSFDPTPEYDVHLHPYPEELLPTQQNPLKNLTSVDVLKYADNMFHFVKVVDQDKILATDVLDDSWKGWLKYLPITNLFQIKDANEIENPSEDAPYTIWDQLLFRILRGFFVTAVKDESDASPDESETTPTIENKFTSIKFDPLGQFANGILQVLKYYSGYESIYDWFDKIEEEFTNYSAFTEEVNSESEIDQSITDAALRTGGVVAFPLPAAALRIARFDPLALGVNALLFVGFHLFLWGVFVPISAYASFYADIDNEDDVNLAADMEDGEDEDGEDEEGDGDGEEGADGEEEADGGEEPDAEDDGIEGDEGDPGDGDQQADDGPSADGMELADDLQPPPEDPADTLQPPSMELADDLQPPPLEPADSLQQANAGQPGQEANFGQQDNFGQQGQPASFGEQGQQADFGQQGQQASFGQQGQQADFGQQGQQADFGQQGQQANFGQQVQQAVFVQQSQQPSDFQNVGQGSDNTRRRDPYTHHNYYSNGYSNYYHQNRYKNVPRPYAYNHRNYNDRHERVTRPPYQYHRYSNRRGSVPAPQYRPNTKDSQSSNYYTHGAIGLHEAYTPQDTNIYPQGK